MDRPTAIIATLAVRIYRASLSFWLGRQCLFHPTCSQRAILSLSELDWNRGIVEINEQLARCRGNFILRTTVSGELELETMDGTTFRHVEISKRLMIDYENRVAVLNIPNTGLDG